MFYFIVSWLKSLNKQEISNSRKRRFFLAFYNQQICERNENFELVTKFAAKVARVNLQQVYILFEEISNRKWQSLKTVREGEVRAFFKLNAKVFVIRAKNLLNNEAKLTT